MAAAKSVSAAAKQLQTPNVLLRTVSKSLHAAVPKPSAGKAMDLESDDLPTDHKSAQSSPPPPPGDSKRKSVGTGVSSVSAAAASSLGVGNALGYSPPITRSADDQEKLIALYRAGSSANGGSPGGLRNKHIQTFIPTPFTPFVSGASTLTAVLNANIAQGTTWLTRVGAGVVQKHITIRDCWTWFENSTTNIIDCIARPVRMIVFWDRMPQAPAPILANDNSGQTTDFSALLNTLGAVAGGSDDTYTCAPFNINTHGFRYEVIHDMLIKPQTGTTQIAIPNSWTNNSPTTANSVTSTQFYSFGQAQHTHRIDLKGKITEFMGTTGAANTIATNALYVCYIADIVGSASAKIPQCHGFMYDMAFQDTQS